MKLIAAILLLWGFSWGAAVAQISSEPGAGWEDEKLRAYIKELQAHRTAIFFAECKGQQGEKLVMILPIGSTKGLFVDITDSTTRQGSTVKTPVNWADMSWKNGKWHYYIYFGGMWLLQYESDAVEFLLRSSFRILKPAQLDTISTSEPRQKCPYRQCVVGLDGSCK